jgi:hypothetical protein
MSSADVTRSSGHKVPALRLTRLMRPVFSALRVGLASVFPELRWQALLASRIVEGSCVDYTAMVWNSWGGVTTTGLTP